MKTQQLLFIALLTSITTFAQTVEGTYTNSWQAKSGEGISYNLTLHIDGTFTFQSISSYMDPVHDKTVETQGTWSLEDHLLLLTTKGNSNELASNLNLNRARYTSVSPRNPRFNLVKPSFKFYKSDVFYAKDMELLKSEYSVTSSQYSAF